MDAAAASAMWASSGAAGLSGRRDGPELDVPVALVEVVTRATARLAESAGLVVDGLALLGERAACTGFRRNGSISCGGAARLLPAADGWLALSLARGSDVESLPAWLERDVPGGDEMWDAVAAVVRRRPVRELLERAVLLGLPIGALGEHGRATAAPPRRTRRKAARAARPLADAVVVDLSAMWAGPLAANLLGIAGARVIKVESVVRPDGARSGDTTFFDLLHGGHESVCVDFRDGGDVDALRRLLGAADIVIESSRPRALHQLGLGAEHIVGPKVWLAISAHGSAGGEAQRVGFGDDAAVAGGLVTWEGDQPRFCCDAVADPLTGLTAAAAVLDAWASEGAWTLDVPLAAVAASTASGPRTSIAGHRVAPPRARPPSGAAAMLGADTEAVLRELA